MITIPTRDVVDRITQGAGEVELATHDELASIRGHARDETFGNTFSKGKPRALFETSYLAVDEAGRDDQFALEGAQWIGAGERRVGDRRPCDSVPSGEVG